MATIPGGCGVPSHSLRLSQRKLKPAANVCAHCARKVLTTRLLRFQYYSCAECGYKLCESCGIHRSKRLSRQSRTNRNSRKVPRSSNLFHPTNHLQAQQRTTASQVSHRSLPRKSTVKAAQSSSAGPSEYLYEADDSDDDDQQYSVPQQRSTANVAESSRASPLAWGLFEMNVSSDDADEGDVDDDDEKQPRIACAGSISHELQFLRRSPYNQYSFGCNMCGKFGSNDLYHCETCQFDAHKACAEIGEEVKVFFHKHPLHINHITEEEVTCRFCLGETEGDIRPWVYMCPNCPNFAVHARCAKYNKSLKHKSHPHKLELVQIPAIDNSPERCCDGCGDSIHQGYHYTCTKPSCDFDLHPLCAILPSAPLCRLNSTHRVKLDYQALGSEKCALCPFQADKADWVYRCMVCDVCMHIDCFTEELHNEELELSDWALELSDEELDFNESDEEDEDFGEALYQKSIASMEDFGNQGIEEQMDKFSELVDIFKNNTKAASSLARQHSVKSSVNRKISTPAESVMHILDHGFSNMSLDDNSRLKVRKSDAEEEERRRTEKAAREQFKQKDKAARREEKAKRAQEVANHMQNISNQLQKLQSQKQSGSNDALFAQEFAALKASIENSHAQNAKRHEEQAKLHHERHQEYMNRLQEIIRTQVHSTTRAVPRLVLCTETTSKIRKVITSFRVGLKGVHLHLLCEHEQQPHLVAGAPGCEINQKVAGDRWTTLQPFLAAGVQIMTMAINFAGMGTGMSALSTILPDFHQKVRDTLAIDLGKHAVPTGRNKLVSHKEAEREEAAAQWLNSYLKDRNINIAETFKLFRVRYKSPDSMKGTIGWLCLAHRDHGMKNRVLEHFPVP